MSLPPPVPPCIVANPDISGIGVRAAIYIQNLLSFIPALTALRDGEVAPYELESVETQSTTILITAFAILIAAIVEARAFILSNFHTSIILSLSWMNNTNTFIYFLLYTQYKSQAGPQQIRADLSSWVRLVRNWFSASITLENHYSDDPEARKQSIDPGNPPENIEHQQRSLLSVIFRVQIRGIVAILGSLHLSMMSALGIWLWHNPREFGNGRGGDNCAMAFASYSIIGRHIPFRSNGLRMASIVIYSIFLAPGINLFLPMALFIGILSIYRACHGPRTPKLETSSTRGRPTTPPPRSPPKSFLGRTIRALQAWRAPFILPTLAGLTLLFAINLILIGDTELTLQHNARLVTAGEGQWTFGQVLAVLLLALPLRDLRVFGKRRDVSAELLSAVRWRARTEVLRSLVRRGADVNVRAEGSTYPTVLLLAVAGRRDIDFAQMLLVYGANPDVPDGTGSTALQAASSHANTQIVRLLLAHDADPNIQGGEYGTALQAAASAGSLEIVQLLLERGARVDVQGGKYGTALKAAESCGHGEIANLLRSRGATV